MKKLSALVLIFALVFAFAACGANPETPEESTSLTADDGDGFASMVNPVTSVDSLEALNKALDCKFEQPGVMGVTDEAFSKTDCGEYTLGQYNFTVNGVAYTWRFACVAGEDISGVYAGDGTIFPAEPESDFEYAEGDNCKAARWFTIDGQYVLIASDEGKMTKEQFIGIAEELKDLTATGMTENECIAYYDSLEGSYADNTSKRASATIKSKGKDGVEIEVVWADSAFKTCYWTMTATFGETDGLLNYTDCKQTIVMNEENEETEKVVYENGEGFFTPQEDGTLLWNGAADENCTECVFALMPID